MLGERSEYNRDTLELEDLVADPIEQLRLWVDEALTAKLDEPMAMCVASAHKGVPSARMVLMRGLDEKGLVFFTNYESRKGRELTENPACSAVFWWGSLQRQVRVEGVVEKTSAEESDAYFDARPRDRQIASAASPQSTVISGREVLEARIEELDARYPGNVPRPEGWGGFRIVPHTFEFWQGRSARLHDRFRYRKEGSMWVIERLAP